MRLLSGGLFVRVEVLGGFFRVMLCPLQRCDYGSDDVPQEYRFARTPPEMIDRMTDGPAKSGALEPDDATRWMIERLEEHLAVMEANDQEAREGERLAGLPLTQRIVAKVRPEMPLHININEGYWQWEVEVAIRQTLKLLEHRAEVQKYLGTDGPVMQVNQLHPVVWNAAKDLWRDEHYGQAVNRAATFLNAHIQDKSGRTDISDKNLMTQVFNPDRPKAGSPRLHWRGDVSEETLTSMREGLQKFAMGASQAIRNPAAHGTDEVPKQVALERLAALSVLARWIDECDLVEVKAGGGAAEQAS